MSAEAPMLIRRFGVGALYVCTLTVSRRRAPTGVECSVRWIPCVPEVMSYEERRDWSANRDAVLATIAPIARLPASSTIDVLGRLV